MFRATHAILILAFVFGEAHCGAEIPPLIPDPGAWYPNGQCPSGTFIKAVRLPVAERKGLTAGRGRITVEIDPVGYSDETGLKYLEIYCANTGKIDTSSAVNSVYTLDENFSYLTCPGNTYASSYQLFFTNKKDHYDRSPIWKAWYLGPHQFANNSASSLRLFCGRGIKIEFRLTPGPADEYGIYPQSTSSCGHSWTDENDWAVLCGLTSNKPSWSISRQKVYNYTTERSFDRSCCLADKIICSGGTTSKPSVRECDNTKGSSSVSCTFERRVGVSYRELEFYNDKQSEKDEALAQRNMDISSHQKLGLTLNNVGPFLLNNFNYREGFNYSSLPETISGEVNHGSVSFSVPAGQKSVVRQVNGECGLYLMNTDVYEVTYWDSKGQQIKQSEDAYPLRPSTAV